VFKGYDDAVQGPFVRPHLDSDGKLAGRITALLIDAADGPVLVDAGMGAFGGEIDAGHVLEELERLDVRTADIRTVVITHGHADHVGGLVGLDGEPTFADARHLIHRSEAAFWASGAAAALPGGAGEPAAAALRAARAAGLLEELEGGADVGADVRVIVAPGHTPGHLGVVISDVVLWAGDAFVAPLNVSHPEWVSAADMDGAGSLATRLHLLGRAADEGLLLAATHMPVELRVTRDRDGFTIA
jgi:glyoxylase-like metal-dependent hydrolase (beta-lactamase superfamily II)